MKILILEDEKLAAERLQGLLDQLNQSVEVIGVIRSVEKGKLWFADHESPDLILSDIQLLDGLSFEIFRQHKVMCPIIFTTAFDQYALDAFQVNGTDYLLKPVQFEKLQASIEKVSASAMKALISEKDLESLADLLDRRKKKFKSRFLVKLGQKIKSVPVEAIAYFFTESKVTFLMTTSREKFPVDSSLDDLESLLDPDLFIRANRKYMISLESVKVIHPHFKGRVVLDLEPPVEEDLVVSSEKTPQLKSWLDR